MGSVRAVGLLLGVLGGALCGPHSLRYFLIGVSEPSPGVPEFMSVGYVDGNLIVRYDSETRRLVPQVDWMAANLDQEYWDRESSKLQRHQQMNRVNMETLRSRYNQSRGAHTMQRMIGCDLLEDGGTRGYYQHAYDGRDFIALDMDTMTFTAVDAGAQITKRKWEDGTVAEQQKHYVEKICVESLKKYVSYGRAVLERKERPTVRVSGKEGAGFLTLQCRAYGFYPRAITVSWLKDGEVRDQETERGSVVPNSDGTYYTWASIDVRPGEKDKYRCRVEHASLPEAEVYVWETGSNWLAISVCVAVLAVVAICGVIRWKKSGNYGVAASEYGGRSCSSQCPVPGWSRGSGSWLSLAFAPPPLPFFLFVPGVGTYGIGRVSPWGSHPPLLVAPAWPWLPAGSWHVHRARSEPGAGSSRLFLSRRHREGL